MEETWQDIVEVFFSEQRLERKYRYFYDALHRVCIEKRKPLLSIATGGLSGACVKPVALRCV